MAENILSYKIDIYNNHLMIYEMKIQPFPTCYQIHILGSSTKQIIFSITHFLNNYFNHSYDVYAQLIEQCSGIVYFGSFRKLIAYNLNSEWLTSFISDGEVWKLIYTLRFAWEDMLSIAIECCGESKNVKMMPTVSELCIKLYCCCARWITLTGDI